MSRVGKKPITMPAGVTVTVNQNDIEVKGPKGTLSRRSRKASPLSQEEGSWWPNAPVTIWPRFTVWRALWLTMPCRCD